MPTKECAVLRMSERRWLVAERSLGSDYYSVLGECGDLDSSLEVAKALGAITTGKSWFLVRVSDRQWVIGRYSSRHVTPLITCKTKYTGERVYEAVLKDG